MAAFGLKSSKMTEVSALCGSYAWIQVRPIGADSVAPGTLEASTCTSLIKLLRLWKIAHGPLALGQCISGIKICHMANGTVEYITGESWLAENDTITQAI